MLARLVLYIVQISISFKDLPNKSYCLSKGSDIADDMSIHINEELISDKLECGLGSTRAKSVFFPEYVVHDNLKPLNVQDIILEEDSSSEGMDL